MKVYRIDDTSWPNGPTYAATRKDAQGVARQKHWNEYDVRVELIEVPTDRNTVLGYLNDKYPEFTVVRRWALTRRGGLKPIDYED